MKTRFFLISLLGLFLFLSHCKKDDPMDLSDDDGIEMPTDDDDDMPNDDDMPDNVDTTPIVFNYLIIDPSQEGINYITPSSFFDSFDINGDGIHDFEMKYGCYYNLAGDISNTAQLKSLHPNFAFNTFEQRDTLIFYIKFSDSGDTCKFYTNAKHSSAYMDADSIVFANPVEIFEIPKLSIGDTIRANLRFLYDEEKWYDLRYRRYSYDEWPGGTCYGTNLLIGDWGNMEQNRYVAFRLLQDDITLVGWMKIDLIFDQYCSGSTFKINEIAYVEITE